MINELRSKCADLIDAAGKCWFASVPGPGWNVIPALLILARGRTPPSARRRRRALTAANTVMVLAAASAKTMTPKNRLGLPA